MPRIHHNQFFVAAALLVSLMTTGCSTLTVHDIPLAQPVPRELQKVTLPEYVIEPPDVLLVEAVRNVRPPEEPLLTGDSLIIRGWNLLDPLEADDEIQAEFKRINGIYPVENNGHVDLGPEYGTVSVDGLTLEEAKAAVMKHLKNEPAFLEDPQVRITLAEAAGKQAIAGDHLVRPDGTIALGIYGAVHVTGLTLSQAKEVIEEHLSQYMVDPEVVVDVLAYNSKVFYIVADGGGTGDQVYRMPITGNETVLDAFAAIDGLPQIASKADIWIARPAPPEMGYEQILPVDWDGITRGAATSTNYQLLPGDRLYVKADPWITFDTVVSKIIAPWERMMGVTLLGHGLIRSIQFGHDRNAGGGRGGL